MIIQQTVNSQYVKQEPNLEMKFVRNKWFRTAVKNCFSGSNEDKMETSMFDPSVMVKVCDSILNMLTSELHTYNST